jgi:type I restriction enzyme, S subunit
LNAGLKPYGSYRESGLAWFGEIPSHWEPRRLKQCVERFFGGGTPESGNAAYYSDSGDGVPWVVIADMTRQSRIRSTAKAITEAGRASRNLQILPKGSVLYSMYASVGSVSILEIDATINQAIIGMQPKENYVLEEFLFYFLENLRKHVSQLASSSTQANLSAEKVRSLPVLVPTFAEQRAIARFLQHCDHLISRLIRNKRRLIALLNEEKQAIIQQAVTHGLDPDVLMKPSGVEWLGEIPAHWEVRRIKSLSQVRRGHLLGQ